MLPNLYLFFIVAVSIIGESSGRNCYSCSSTPSAYDNDCYRGHSNASTTTCPLGDNYCFSRVVNNFDGSFNVTRNCNSFSVSSKDITWGESSSHCNQDLCNNLISHLPPGIPEVTCYLCTSTPADFNEGCYYGRSNVLTTTCEGICTAIFDNNFDGTFNITRDCSSFDQRKLNKRVWWKYIYYCWNSFCNNVTRHLELISSTPSSNLFSTPSLNPSSTPSSNPFSTPPLNPSSTPPLNTFSTPSSKASNGGQCAWLFLGTTFIIRVITANAFYIN